MPWIEKHTKIGNEKKKKELYHSFRPAGVYFPRGENRQESSLYQVERNEINSKRHLEELIDANFGPRDLHIILTYEDMPPSPDAAKQDQKKFARYLREYEKKANIVVKWIAVTEYREGIRIHHHLVISGINYDQVRFLWENKPDPAHRGQHCKWDGHGIVLFENLDGNGDYKSLAYYLSKENKPGEHGWTSSRNLEKPEVILYQTVTRWDVDKERYAPKIPEGYYIAEENHYVDKYGYWQLHFKCKKLRNVKPDKGEPDHQFPAQMSHFAAAPLSFIPSQLETHPIIDRPTTLATDYNLSQLEHSITVGNDAVDRQDIVQTGFAKCRKLIHSLLRNLTRFLRPDKSGTVI